MTVNRLFYLDYHSNAMMILANYLASENFPGRRTELDIINDIVGVEELVSFRIAINYSVREETAIPMLVNKLLSAKQNQCWMVLALANGQRMPAMLTVCRSMVYRMVPL